MYFKYFLLIFIFSINYSFGINLKLNFSTILIKYIVENYNHISKMVINMLSYAKLILLELKIGRRLIKITKKKIFHYRSSWSTKKIEINSIYLFRLRICYKYKHGTVGKDSIVLIKLLIATVYIIYWWNFRLLKKKYSEASIDANNTRRRDYLANTLQSCGYFQILSNRLSDWDQYCPR